MQRTLPHGDSTHIQPPSAMPAAQRGARVDEQVVVRVDLAQPGVLRVPRVVHRHRPLRHRVERVLRRVGGLLLERRVVEGQRVEVGLARARAGGPAAACPGCLPCAARRKRCRNSEYRWMTIGSRSRRRPHAAAPSPCSRWFQLRMYCSDGGSVVLEDAVVLRVHLPLLRVGLAAHRLLAALAAPAGEEADARARRGLVVDDEVGVVAVLARCRRR